MEVFARYQLLSKCTITAMSFNPNHSLLALTADGNDTATFFMPGADLSLIPKFVNESRPSSLACIAWSPNGRYIGVAGSKIEVWKFENMKLSPIGTFQEGFVEIKNLVWAPDSKSYLCNGINSKQQKISINIRNVETKQLRQIYFDEVIAAASFDPFGKYVAVLLKSNLLEIYDLQTLEKVHRISMAYSKKDIPPFKQHRIMDWSPDFGMLLVPNLNEAKAPTAIFLDRNNSFKIHRILAGHTSPINCVKFNPLLYEHEGRLCFIVAVGDAGGCISLWRIYRQKSPQENSQQQHLPLTIFTSPRNAEQCIESLQWNKNGTELYGNCLKKYVVCFGFSLKDFGRPLAEYEKSDLIMRMYGAAGAGQITGAKLEVFGIDMLGSSKEKSIDPKHNNPTTPPISHEFAPQSPLPPPQNLVRTEQEVITGTNKKKRIIPSRMVPESTLLQQQTSLSFQQQALPSLRLPPLKSQLKKQYVINENYQMTISTEGPLRVISVAGKDLFKRRAFPGEITDIKILKESILVIYCQRLFIFSFELDLLSLPILVGEISLWASNNQGIVYYMLVNGLIRGFNYLTRQFITETSIAYICQNNQSPDQPITELPINSLKVYDRDSGNIHIEMKENGVRYFFSRESSVWEEMDFQNGSYRPGHSLRVTDTQKMTTGKFFTQFVKNSAPSLKNDPKFNQLLGPYELEVVYYRHYDKNQTKYKETLLKMMSEIKATGKEDNLRDAINRYFINPESPDYIDDPILWQKVRSMGGSVIEEFSILAQR